MVKNLESGITSQFIVVFKRYCFYINNFSSDTNSQLRSKGLRFWV